MSNKIFNSILDDKIKSFVKTFNKQSEEIFIDKKTGKLIHPGEFGTYRERALQDFLTYVTPSKLSIGTGFIIGHNDFISNQSDIVVFDKKTTPLIQTKENQTFFPIETTVAVGEVKSKLSKTELKKALRKLSKIKQHRASINVSSTTYREIPKDPEGNKLSYNPEQNPNDNVVTFLICKKLDFKIDNVLDDLDTFYQKENIPQYARHNIILSIKDGIFLYANNQGISTYAPVLFGSNQVSRSVTKQKKYDNLKMFANNIFLATSSGTVIYHEISEYINQISSGVIKDK